MVINLNLGYLNLARKNELKKTNEMGHTVLYLFNYIKCMHLNCIVNIFLDFLIRECSSFELK